MIVRQHCCKQNTHFPAKMKSCESIPHTITSYFANDSPIDHIISISKNSLHVSNVRILPYLITDHKPIFCKVNQIPIVSWNIEGLCNTNEMTIERLHSIQKILKKLHSSYPNIIFLFQEIFLKSEIKKNKHLSSLDRLKELFYHPQYTYKSDNYSSGIIIPTHLFSTLDLIQRKHTHKYALVIYIKSQQPFYLVNIHLKAVQSLDQDHIHDTHLQELNNILKKLKYKLNKGAVFIGDHNNTDVLPIYSELITTL